MRANSIIVRLMFPLKVLIINVKTHIISTSNYTLHNVKFFTGFDTLFWPIFADFKNEAAGSCVNPSHARGV